MLNIQDFSKEDKIIVIPDKLPLWEQKLQERGILNAAKKLAGVKPMNYKGISGWSYPLYQSDGKLWVLPDGRPSIRFKAFDKSSKISYAWGHSDQGKDDVKKLEHCNYYWLPGTKQAILDNGGTLFITAGEPDMWTLLECGVRNVTTFFGESNIPDKETLLRNLHSLNVKLVKYLPDPDEAGMKAAQKLHDRLYGSDIGFTALKLSDSDTQDVNDLFRAVEFDKKSMVRLILEAERYEFELPVMDLPNVGQSKSSDFEPPAELLQELYQAMGLKKQDGKEYSEKITCPKHNDKNPSAQWNFRTRNLECLAGCESTGWKATAELYGVDWRKYLDTAKPQLEKPAAPDQKEPEIKQRIPMVTGREARQRVRDKLSGKNLPRYAPIIFPFKSFHRFSGYAHLLTPRKMTLILGLTGGGKTSLMECFADVFIQKGVHVGWWGSEWSPDEMEDRRIVRMGGLSLTETNLHVTAQIEQKTLGKVRDGIFAVEKKIERTYQIMDQVDQWRGDLVMVDKSGVTLDDMLQRIQIDIDERQNTDSPLRVFVWDYAQLLELSRAYADKDRINISINMIKNFVGDNDLIGIIATQPNKAPSANVRQNSEHTDTVLTGEDANFLSMNAFNLALTLNPQYSMGTMSDRGIINIVKNSGGSPGRVALKMALHRLSWLDELHHKQ